MSKDTSRKSTWLILKRLFEYIKPHKLWFMLSIISMVAIIIADVIWAYLIMRMIDYALKQQGNGLTVVTFQIVIMLIVGITIKYVSTYSTEKFSILTMRDLRRDIVNHTCNISVSTIENGHSGDIMSRLSNDASVLQHQLIYGFLGIIYQPLMLVLASTFLAFWNWKLLLVSVIPIPFAVLISNSMSRSIGDNSSKSLEQIGTANCIIQDTVGGIDILKAFNLERPLYKRFRNAIDKSLYHELKISKQITMLIPIEILLKELPFLVCIVFGGYLSINGKMEVAVLVMFIRLIRYVIDPSSKMIRTFSNMRTAVGAAKRLFDILDTPVERIDGKEFDKLNLSDTDQKNVIQFENVSFSYKEPIKVLDGVSFSVQNGKVLAIVGQSGCGKSTIVNLLCSFYNGYSGAIKLFGENINNLSLIALRKQISLVSQSTFLFPGTIEENIRYGNPKASRDEVVSAAKTANAHQFIMNLPEGYETKVGERGIKLSGGERQRISIARAILKNAPVLILDEPTSAMDSESEALIKEALDNVMENRTVIVISHRLSVINNADKIIVLDKGRVVETGNHEELLALNRVYKQLYVKQSLCSA